jgi:glycosyltransferase involved in cell wall biosynthesis
MKLMTTILQTRTPAPTAEEECEGDKVSVLISTYARESARNLAESLESIYAQTVAPRQLVLVIDGPIGADQEEVIEQCRNDTRISDLTLVRLPSNVGLARAMNAGLEQCTGQFIMRADSDDICDSRRLELQLDYFRQHSETDVVTSWCTEFYEDGRPESLKASSVCHDAVAHALRWRNVLVHPTVLIRTRVLRAVGGYRPGIGLLEDYDLYVRLILDGVCFHVIPKALVRVRTNIDQRRRRGGLRYCWNEVKFRFFCLRSGFLNLREFVLVTFFYIIFRLIGGTLRQRLYALSRV